MKGKMYKKWVFIIVCIVILAGLLIPIPAAFDDGGTRQYRAIIYTVTRWRSIWEEDGYDGFLIGTQIDIFGRRVFDNTRFEPYETDSPRK